MLKLAMMVVLMLAAAPALAAVDCRFWPASHFFETATVTDVHFCIDAGADVNERGEYGETPLLHAAIFSKDPAVIPALLAAGADPDAGYYPGTGNETPLYYAVINFDGNPSAVEALLAAGANVHVRAGKYGSTPLHRAAGHGENPAVIEALLAAGADVNAPDGEGFTPLHWAVMHNENPAVIAALIGTGADVNARDADDFTPLHWAAGNSDNIAVIVALIDTSADVNARNTDGHTPLQIARNRNRHDAVSVLLKAGATE